MSVGAPEEAQAPAGRSPEAPRPRVRSGSSARGVWLAAVVLALIAGVVGGYLLRWGIEPMETATKTVGNIVTRTVAPDAYTTSDRVHVQVDFDGTTCRYTGPAELMAGSTVAVTYTSTVEDSGWFIWWLQPGTTYEQLMRSDARRFSDQPTFVSGYLGAGPSGSFGGSNPWTRISEGELISIGCQGDGPGDVFHATMLRVL